MSSETWQRASRSTELGNTERGQTWPGTSRQAFASKREGETPHLQPKGSNIHSLSQYLWSPNSMPDTVLGTGVELTTTKKFFKEIKILWYLTCSREEGRSCRKKQNNQAGFKLLKSNTGSKRQLNQHLQNSEGKVFPIQNSIDNQTLNQQ